MTADVEDSLIRVRDTMVKINRHQLASNRNNNPGAGQGALASPQQQDGVVDLSGLPEEARRCASLDSLEVLHPEAQHQQPSSAQVRNAEWQHMFGPSDAASEVSEDGGREREKASPKPARPGEAGDADGGHKQGRRSGGAPATCAYNSLRWP